MTKQQRTLWDAIATGRVENVHLAVQQGVDLNQPDSDDHSGETPLFYAAIVSTSDMVHLLQSLGANHNISHLVIAASIGKNTELIQELAGQGADVNWVAPDGDTALTEAIEAGDPATVELLLQLGADPRYTLPWGATMLDIARREGNPQIITLLQGAAQEREATQLPEAVSKRSCSAVEAKVLERNY